MQHALQRHKKSLYPRELWCIKRVSFHAVTTFVVLVWLT